MNRKKILIITSTVLLVAVLALIITYTQFTSPLIVKETTMRISEYGTGFTFDDFKDLYEYCTEEGHNDYQYIRQKDVFPSDNGDDYCKISINAKVQNTSFLDINVYNSYVLCDDENSPIILVLTDIEEGVNKFENDDLFICSFDVYRGNMTDKELCDYIKTLELEIYYGNSVDRNCTQTIDLSKCVVE